MEPPAPRGGEGRVASGRTVPARGVHCDQPRRWGEAGGGLLQPAWHGRTVDQRGQARGAIDTPVVPQLRSQSGTSTTARAGVQSGQLTAASGAAGEREALDAHDAAGEADQDRDEDGASRPIRDVPTGGGGNPAGAVSGHSASHPPVRRDLPEGCTDMTSRGNGKI